MTMATFVKKSAIACLIASLTVSSALSAEAVSTLSLNVRSGPSTGYAVVDTLYAGEPVTVTQCTEPPPGWCYINHSGPDGWVSAKYLAAPTAGGGGGSSSSDAAANAAALAAILGFGAAMFGAATNPPPAAPPPNLPYGPDTCKQGYVWRDAIPGDHVCVVPARRSLAAQENATAGARVDPLGAYGPNSCKPGFVWREAYSGDVVCVTGARRSQVAQENADGPSHRVLP